MTESFVTQCPHCRTSFKVSHNQLSVARGAVRCGACKQVFNAARQLLEQSTGQAAAASGPTREPAPTEVTAPHLPSSPVAWQASSAHLDQLDLDEELARLERRPAPTREQGTTPSILSANRDQAEDWLEEPFGDHQHSTEDDTTAVLVENTREEPRLGADSEPLLDDEPPALDRRRPLKVEPAVVPPRAAEASVRNEPALRDEHLLELHEDPLELQWEKPRSSLGKRFLWAGLSLVAALALMGQYVAFHFDELARQDSYRPWFVTLCPTVGCTVPPRVDIHMIRSSNLVVRSHPTFTGALVVDAIIYNRASFGQPFPLLELRFADLNNKMIASRRFKPSEYLSGDLAGQGEMPPQVPIHIALDILDPGKRAVNYSLSFHSPD
jgi:predicted Zn finger-like uncharacterized protein